jgi:hypothetical protein
MYQFFYVKLFSTNQNGNLVLLDDYGRVRSQITSVVCEMQRFDFDWNLVVTRKVIMGIPPVLGRNPLYYHNCHRASNADVFFTSTILAPALIAGFPRRKPNDTAHTQPRILLRQRTQTTT